MLNFENLDKHLETLAAEQAFPGGVLCVYHHGKMVKETAYGVYNPETGDKTNVDTRFDVASISKMFAGTAFMALCDRGVFSLDEPIHKSFPKFVGQREIRASANALLKDQPDALLGYADVTDLTWYNILIHDSGLGWSTLNLLFKTREEAVDHICTMPLAYEPKSTVLYTDLGLILMAIAMEERTGKTLDVLVDELVCQPLGLERTGYNRVSEGPKCDNTAPTEFCKWRNVRVHGLVHDENCYFLDGVAGHAGVFSIARDVAKLAQNYLDVLQGKPGVVKKETAEAMVTFQKMNRWDRRGIMFQLRILDTDAHTFPLGRKTFGHTGFTGTCMWADPERELAFAFLTNDVYPGREKRSMARVRKGIVEHLISAIDKEDTCK
ncbi:MAG: beta-lactamase family protein [Clostridia bacterium]|nr:beta-lactamase family protein [Clostridia bacterium]